MVKSSIFIIITAIMLVNNNHIYIYIYTLLAKFGNTCDFFTFHEKLNISVKKNCREILDHVF